MQNLRFDHPSRDSTTGVLLPTLHPNGINSYDTLGDLKPHRRPPFFRVQANQFRVTQIGQIKDSNAEAYQDLKTNHTRLAKRTGHAATGETIRVQANQFPPTRQRLGPSSPPYRPRFTPLSPLPRQLRPSECWVLTK